MGLNNRPTKNQNPETVPRQKVGTSLPTEETTPVEEEAQRAIDDRNLLLDRVAELGGPEALGISLDAPFSALYDAVATAEVEQDEREEDERQQARAIARERRERADAARRLGRFFIGLAQRGLSEQEVRDAEEQSREGSGQEQRATGTIKYMTPDERRRSSATEAGLDPETATESDIENEWARKHAEQLEEQRVALGLGSEATQEDVHTAQQENATRLFERVYGPIDETNPEGERQRCAEQVLKRLRSANIDPQGANKTQLLAAFVGLNPGTTTDEDLRRLSLSIGHI